MTHPVTIKNNDKSISVTIHTERVEEDLTNQISKIAIAKGKSNQSPTSDHLTKIIDLKKIIHSMEIRGTIKGDASETADDKKNKLIQICDSKPPIYVDYRSNTDISTVFDKMKFIDDSKVKQTSSTSAPQYTVIIHLIKGEPQ